MKTILGGILFLFVQTLFTQTLFAQTAVERIGYMIEQQDWFQLKREFLTYKDSLPPAMQSLTEALLFCRFNQPEKASETIAKLLNEHQAELDASNTIRMTQMLADCWHTQGKNEDAAQLIEILCQQLKAISIDHKVFQEFEKLRDQYKELSSIGHILQMEKPEKEIIIPIRQDTTFGNLIYINGKLNGKDEDILVDTGAGVNIVSPEAAKKYRLRILNAATSVAGIETGSGKLAIADNLQIGEIIFRNVPFHVLNMLTGNEEADKEAQKLRTVIGLPILNKLEEVQLDFIKQSLIVPQVPTSNPFPSSNLYLADNKNLISEVFFNNEGLHLKLDTGADGSSLFPSFYKKHKETIERTGVRDIVRRAGFGGVQQDTVYRFPDICIQTGSSTGCMKQIDVSIDNATSSDSEIDGIFGIDLFTAYAQVIINLKSMFVETTARPNPKTHLK